MAEQEILKAAKALKAALKKSGKRAALAELVGRIEAETGLDEESIRSAFWLLAGEKEIIVDRDFRAILAPPPTAKFSKAEGAKIAQAEKITVA